MNNNFEEIVRTEFRKVVGVRTEKDIDDIPISELGIDSLDFFETVIHLEEEFGIEISIDKLDNAVTLRDLIASLKE